MLKLKLCYKTNWPIWNAKLKCLTFKIYIPFLIRKSPYYRISKVFDFKKMSFAFRRDFKYVCSQLLKIKPPKTHYFYCTFFISCFSPTNKITSFFIIKLLSNLKQEIKQYSSDLCRLLQIYFLTK